MKITFQQAKTISMRSIQLDIPHETIMQKIETFFGKKSLHQLTELEAEKLINWLNFVHQAKKNHSLNRFFIGFKLMLRTV